MASALGLASAAAADELSGTTLTADPFQIQTDVGGTVQEENATAARLMPKVRATADYLLATYRLSPRCFDDYAAFHDTPDHHFDRTIRIRVWRSYEYFCADYQRRYKTRSIPGAFFGITSEQDARGQDTGTLVREIGTASEGGDEAALLRDIYHEMGHLFMRTYIMLPVEVPSWIEEGTAQIIQYRIDNGTHPEGERDQREGWLREMLDDGSLIPWREMIAVRNLDNLAFTYQDPLRSQIQYVQAWSMVEFMVASPQRQEDFLAMLRRFKQGAEDHAGELQNLASSPEDFLNRLQGYLYGIQEKTFERSYGARLLDIEAEWKRGLRLAYEADLAAKPQLLYYRGDWCLARADLSRPGDDPKALRATATAIFRSCAATHPDSPYGDIGMGRVAIAEGHLREAAAHFDHALALGAATFEAQLYGGVGRVLAGNGAAAVEPLLAAVAARPTDALAQRFLGQALALAGRDYAAAIAHLRLARALDPRAAPDCSFIEGAVAYLSGHRRDALTAWMRTQALRGAYADILLYQALALADGSRQEAISLLASNLSAPGAKSLTALLADPAQALPTVGLTSDGWPCMEPPAVASATRR